MRHLLLLTFIFLATAAQAASLEDQLQSIGNDNRPPEGISRENLYAVQARYLPLEYKTEITVGGAMNLTNDSFLSSNQFEAGVHFHFNDRWAVEAEHDFVYNHWTSAGDNLRSTNGAVPDDPYVKSRTMALVDWHAFYGKFRWSMDTVSYFDQYWALGGGVVDMNTGMTPGVVADVGFVFWIGRHSSFRFGLKDYLYNEEYSSGTKLSSNLHPHANLGVVF